MFELIEKLRAKTDKTKKRVAFSVAGSIAGVIFVVWLSVMIPGFNSGGQQTKVLGVEPSPISTFGEVLYDSFSAIGEQFVKIKEVFSSVSNNSSYYSATTTIVSSTTTLSQ